MQCPSTPVPPVITTTLSNGKQRVILLNKSDMADEKVTVEWKKYYESKGYFVAVINSKTGEGVKSTVDIISKACAEKLERDRKKEKHRQQKRKKKRSLKETPRRSRGWRGSKRKSRTGTCARRFSCRSRSCILSISGWRSFRSERIPCLCSI